MEGLVNHIKRTRPKNKFLIATNDGVYSLINGPQNKLSKGKDIIMK